jgi:hypothetical protein
MSATELETWRREWREVSDPLPDLKKKIRRQNRRMVLVVAILCFCLAASTVAALRTGNSFLSGLAAGLWVTSVLSGCCSWWVRRGTWRPAAQTTRAFLELSYKRAVAKSQTIRFCVYFLAIAMLLYAGALLYFWSTSSLKPLGLLVFAAMIAELFFLRRLGRRKQREVQETRRLLEQITE